MVTNHLPVAKQTTSMSFSFRHFYLRNLSQVSMISFLKYFSGLAVMTPQFSEFFFSLI